jgi:MFS family permease
MVGPLIAAAMFGTVGAGWVFIANGATFAVMLLGLLRMDVSRFRRIAPAKRSATPIRDGLRVVWADPLLRLLMIVFAVISTFGFNTLVALPLVTNQLLGRNEAFFGYLLSALSAGNVAGSLLVARQVDVSPRMAYGAGAGLGAMLFIGGLSTNTALTVGAVAILGFASTSFVNSTTVILQQRSSEQMRSRILALSAVLFLGSTPIGGPITGIVGDAFGAGWSMYYAAIICGAAAIGGALLAGRAERA